MAKLANISGEEAVKVFIKFGYSHSHTSGDHAILQKPNAPTLSVPLHKEVAPFLLKSQIKRAGMTIEQFLKLLRKQGSTNYFFHPADTASRVMEEYQKRLRKFRLK